MVVVDGVHVWMDSWIDGLMGATNKTQSESTEWEGKGREGEYVRFGYLFSVHRLGCAATMFLTRLHRQNRPDQAKPAKHELPAEISLINSATRAGG